MLPMLPSESLAKVLSSPSTASAPSVQFADTETALLSARFCPEGSPGQAGSGTTHWFVGSADQS